MRRQRHLATEATTSLTTTAGGSRSSRRGVPASVVMLKASWTVQPILQAEVTKLPPGPATTAHGLRAPVRR